MLLNFNVFFFLFTCESMDRGGEHEVPSRHNRRHSSRVLSFMNLNTKLFIASCLIFSRCDVLNILNLACTVRRTSLYRVLRL